MKIYDSVVIKTKNTTYSKINKVKKEFKKRFIKIYDSVKYNDYCEHETLLIQIIENKIIVENRETSINDVFKNYRFVSNIFSDIGDMNIYQKNYAEYIIKKNKQVEKIISKNKYKKNFDLISGAVFISDEEYYLMKKSKLRDAIFINNNNNYKYVIPNENGYLLRGSNTYYYLLANKGKNEKVSIKHFEEFVNNYKDYFKLINTSLDNNSSNLLILSVLDNIRNYLLVLINALIISKQETDETLIYEITNSEYSQLLDNIINVYYLMTSIIYNKKYDISLISNVINKILQYNFLDDIKNIDSKFYDKMLKSHRECDNFLENYLTVLNYMKKEKKDSVFLGVLYGGIELPLIAYYLKNKNIRVVYITLFGIYSQRHKRTLNYEYISKKINNKIKSNKEFKCVLCDDNMLTGKTMQYILDSLIIQNITVDKILLVNHVNMNRIFQIIDNKTLMELSLIDKYIYGLFFSTKYSKIKYGANMKNNYLDEFNLFDLSKEYICYYLYKNKIFSKKSRIYNYTIGGKNE